MTGTPHTVNRRNIKNLNGWCPTSTGAYIMMTRYPAAQAIAPSRRNTKSARRLARCSSGLVVARCGSWRVTSRLERLAALGAAGFGQAGEIIPAPAMAPQRDRAPGRAAWETGMRADITQWPPVSPRAVGPAVPAAAVMFVNVGPRRP